MKLIKITSVLCFMLISFVGANTLNAQASIDDKNMTWYGLDFTKARLIGSEGFTNPEDIKNRFFDSWNDLLRAEKKKYNFEKYFNKTKVDYELDMVEERNETVDEDALVIDDSYRIDADAVRSVVKGYKSKTEEGLGLIFVIESFNKKKTKGNMWVTFFDEKSGKVLKTVRMTGKSGGFGLRNYWAASILNVMKAAKKEFNL